MNASDYAAWYAAIVGTFALFWEIYTYFSKGSKLKVTAMFLFPGSSSPIDVSIYNYGDSPTSIESFAAKHKGTEEVPLFVLHPNPTDLPLLIAPNDHKELSLRPVPISQESFVPQQRLFPDKKALLMRIKSRKADQQGVVELSLWNNNSSNSICWSATSTITSPA